MQGLVGEVVQQVHGGELHDLPQVCKEVQTEGERVGDDKGKFWDHNCVSLTLNKTPEGGSWCLRRLYYDLNRKDTSLQLLTSTLRFGDEKHG